MARKPIKSRQVFAYKKGEVLALDHIYTVNGLCCHTDKKWDPWWAPVNDTTSAGFAAEEETATISSGERVRITRDITIEIIER